jgi:FKBP-type peptidyl-prolyl cis-trans isomerase
MSNRSARARRRAARVRNQRIAIIVVALLVIAAVVYFAFLRGSPSSSSPTSSPSASSQGMVTTASGLQYEDLVVGTGPEAKSGDAVSVNYTGWLEDGTKFDSSIDRGVPFEFTIGAGMVIKGWDEGVAGMRVGGKRKLIIPPDLGYGASGAGDVIPPNATLIFEVDLLEIQK